MFQTVALVGRADDERITTLVADIASHLNSRGRQVLVDPALANGLPAYVNRVPEAHFAHSAELLLAIGGDGTLLHAARLALAAAEPCPVLGVNRGRLGFLADIRPGEMADRLDEVLGGDFERDERRLLEARLETPGTAARSMLALNDVVLQNDQPGRMLDLESSVDGRYVNTHGGDGLIVATATGSTAYALSCGGPILQPDLDVIVVVPICPHTLSDRPLVLRRESRVEVRLVPRARARAVVICDGVTLGEMVPGGLLSVGPSSARLALLHPPGYDYFRVLRSKLHWGRGAHPLPQDGPSD